ncbi:DUF262 domain-containing HNH endonuclease family protein [Cupriavidus sp. DL-D2]|uniref:DUF262 domain-containing HNH endonuclease family protein n=1 Tax=Cupriavidus sp. DL-D2 TaxID=3144974 RepID=UPI0032154058
MIDISKAFSQTSEPVSGFFQQPGAGYYIPLYQREYSWEAENVEQLMEDVFNGVKSLVHDDKEARDRSIHFLGTVILFQESSPKQNIQPRDDRALPTRIDNVIDGQQRLSTIAIIACVLLQHLVALGRKLPKDERFDALRTEVDAKRELLLELFSVDIKRGAPSRKPIILRGSVDGWTFDGADDQNYRSGVASYLAENIRAYVEDKITTVSRPSDKRVNRNVREIKKWLAKVEQVEPSENNDYPSAKSILEAIPEELLWSYPRPELIELLKDDGAVANNDRRALIPLVQLFAFLHYFTERCCFTVIKPVSEEWAFDMFQSLNASGTPLTALETFKPLVVNHLAQENKIFKDTKSNEYFGYVDELIGDTGPTAKKNKLTDEFLTAFALSYDGHALSTQFSLQRRYLNDRFNKCTTPAEREEFVRRMGDLAVYWRDVLSFEPNNDLAIAGLENLNAELKARCGLAVLFLSESGHKMANTILSRFYSRVIRDKDDAAAMAFAEACLAVAAFYALWRAAQSNSGLDDVYRKLMRHGELSEDVPAMSWAEGNDALTVDKLKAYLKFSLGELFERDKWMAKAKLNLRFDLAKPVCKLALFVSSHDTIADPENIGLMKVAASGTRAYLEPSKWVSADFKTIEHIAPVKGQGQWDEALYDSSEPYHSVGNLTLLPGDINSSAGNQTWQVKSIYFRHLAETDLGQLAALEHEAKSIGVMLQPHTIDLLKSASYKHHLESIVNVPATQPWNLALVQRRAERICSILWERASAWLN